MTSLWRLLAATALLVGSLGTLGVTAGPATADDDIAARLKAVPGLTVVAEQAAPAPTGSSC